MDPISAEFYSPGSHFFHVPTEELGFPRWDLNVLRTVPFPHLLVGLMEEV